MMKTGVVRRPWHTREVRLVGELAGKKSAKEISALIGRTESSLSSWAHSMKISLAVNAEYKRSGKRKLHQPWREWELNIVELTILNNHSSLSVEILLTRHSKSAIVQKFSITRKKMREELHEK